MSNDIYNVSIQYESQNYTQAVNEYEKFVQVTDRGSKAEQGATRASQQNAQSKQRLTRATRDATSAQQRVRQQFLATANSIAVLDGPLGGVASRFSAFGVLIGRIGIPLAGLAIGFSTLTFVAQRSIREFADFEVQVSTIENRLRSAGNQINITSSEMVRLADSIGLVTLASEQEIMRAAGQLLTFRNITTEVFEDVLKSATDLAASGFGTVESETVKLAKALEDPRQGLTSLSRAGIVFTRQQRNLIISLADTGREAEAMALILQNVNRQVGGAAESQARDTLAGQFDTIGQALRVARRDFGRWASDLFLVSSAIDMFAESAARFVRGPGLSESAPRDLIQTLTGMTLNDVDQEFSKLTAIVERFGLDVDIPSTVWFRIGGPSLKERLGSFQEDLIDALNVLKEIEDRSRAVAASQTTLSRRAGGLEEMRDQIELQRESIGLTEEQIRVNSMMAQAGLGGGWGAVTEQLEQYRTKLEESGASHQVIARALENWEATLRGIKTVAEETTQVMQDQATWRGINRLSESTEKTNDLMRIQVRILEESRAAGEDIVTVTEAARLAQLEYNIALLKEEEQKILIKAVTEDLTEADVARLNVILATVAALKDQEALTRTLADFSRSGGRGGGGGGGGGTDPNAEFQRELDQLNTYLERRREEMMIAAGFERELVIEQYEERYQILQEALNRGLIQKEQFYEMEIALAQSKEDRITEIEREAHNARLMLTSNIFGNLSSMAQAFGEKQSRTAAIFGGIQATIASYVAATEAMAQTPGDFLTKLSAYSSVLATGMGAVAAISRAGGGGSGGGGRGASGRTAAAPREAREAAPQRVLIQGLDPNALYTGDQLQNLFEAFYNENDNRGKVFVVSQ